MIAKPMSDKVLIVDDDPDVLTAMEHFLSSQFSIFVATGPDKARDVIMREGPFAVIVSDLNMPKTNGIEFLAKAAALWPDTIRILLTGEAETRSAIAAVNQGHIYRFLTKPWTVSVLVLTLKSAIKQYNLIQAERVLLENTLRGAIQVLTEILGLVHPAAFSRGTRIRELVKQLCEYAGIPNPWEFEVAAMLSHIGCIGLPEDLLAKVLSGEPLAPDEQLLYDANLATGARLLENVPRLETVAHIIQRQNEPIKPLPPGERLQSADRVALGSQLLRLSMAMEAAALANVPPSQALEQLQAPKYGYSPILLNALSRLQVEKIEMPVKTIRLAELRPGMLLYSDILDKQGKLLLGRGNTISPTLRECLFRYAELRGVREPIDVLPVSPT